MKYIRIDLTIWNNQVWKRNIPDTPPSVIIGYECHIQTVEDTDHSSIIYRIATCRLLYGDISECEKARIIGTLQTQGWYNTELSY